MTYVDKSLLPALTIANGTDITTTAFNFQHCTSGMVLIPSAWTAANIGFKVSATEDGTYVALREDSSDNMVQITNVPTAESVWKRFPAGLSGAVWVKLFSKSATAATHTGVNQGAARTLYVVTST